MKSHKKLTIFIVICCIACVALLAGIYYRSGSQITQTASPSIKAQKITIRTKPEKPVR